MMKEIFLVLDYDTSLLKLVFGDDFIEDDHNAEHNLIDDDNDCSHLTLLQVLNYLDLANTFYCIPESYSKQLLGPALECMSQELVILHDKLMASMANELARQLAVLYSTTTTTTTSHGGGTVDRLKP